MKRIFSAPGTAPATLVHRADRQKKAPELRITAFDAGGCVESMIGSVAELPSPQDDGKVRWIEMNGLGDIEALRELGEKYHLHPLALEDTLNTGQRPKFDQYESHAFIVAQMIYREPDGKLCHEQVSMFLSKNLLITVQEEPEYDVFDPVRARLRDEIGLMRKHGADYLAYALLDAVIDHLFPVLEHLGNEIEEMEDDLLDNPRPECARMIHSAKRTLTHVRRAVWPERDVVSAMLHDDTGLFTERTKLFLRDCYDHTVQIIDLVESYRDIASGLMELYLSAVGIRTNETMRVLTVISAIFIPLTFVAGVYGMNFDYGDGKYPLNMPELRWPFGYFACLGLMAGIALGQYLFFKKKGWL
jgi:magnesium transporter